MCQVQVTQKSLIKSFQSEVVSNQTAPKSLLRISCIEPTVHGLLRKIIVIIINSRTATAGAIIGLLLVFFTTRRGVLVFSRFLRLEEEYWFSLGFYDLKRSIGFLSVFTTRRGLIGFLKVFFYRKYFSFRRCFDLKAKASKIAV